MIKDFTIYISKDFTKGLGGFVFNIIIGLLLLALVLGIVIVVFNRIYILEKYVLRTSKLLFGLLITVPLMIMFFNINESKVLMWIGLIISVFNLLMFLILPMAVKMYERKGEKQ